MMIKIIINNYDLLSLYYFMNLICIIVKPTMLFTLYNLKEKRIPN